MRAAVQATWPPLSVPALSGPQTARCVEYGAGRGQAVLTARVAPSHALAEWLSASFIERYGPLYP
jgi:hypothetical protein